MVDTTTQAARQRRAPLRVPSDLQRFAFQRDRLPDWSAYADSEGLTLIGKNKWRNVICVFHDDTHPSMRVNTQSGGWCCMSCGAKGGDTLSYHMQAHNMSFIEAAKALGAWDDHGKPHGGLSKPTTLSARDAMEVAAFEMQVAVIVIGDIRRGLIPSDVDWLRFRDCAGRVEALASEYRT